METFQPTVAFLARFRYVYWMCISLTEKYDLMIYMPFFSFYGSLIQLLSYWDFCIFSFGRCGDGPIIYFLWSIEENKMALSFYLLINKMYDNTFLKNESACKSQKCQHSIFSATE